MHINQACCYGVGSDITIVLIQVYTISKRLRAARYSLTHRLPLCSPSALPRLPPCSPVLLLCSEGSPYPVSSLLGVDLPVQLLVMPCDGRFVCAGIPREVQLWLHPKVSGKPTLGAFSFLPWQLF